MIEDLDAGADASTRPSDRRLLVVGLVAALLLGGGGMLLLSGGDEPVAAGTVAVVPRAAVAAATSSPSPTPSPSAPRRHGPHNPFQPRLVGDAPGEDAPLDGLPTPASVPAQGAPLEQPAASPGRSPGESPAAEPVGDPAGVPAQEQPAVPTTVVSVPPAEPPVAGPPLAAPPLAPPVAAPPVDAPPTPAPPTTVRPTAAPQHTLVLTRVTGTTPDLRGRFLVDGEVVTVAPGTAFGPGGTLNLIGLEETGDGWVAVLQVGTAQPRNHPLGAVLRFS